MLPKIILISGAPGIQRWKVAAKIQQWQVSYFSSFKPKSSRDINSFLVLRNHSETSRRIHVVQSWTLKRWLLIKIQRSTVVIQMRRHFKLSQDNFKSHFKITSKNSLNYSKSHWKVDTRWRFESGCRSGTSTGCEVGNPWCWPCRWLARSRQGPDDPSCLWFSPICTHLTEELWD